MAIDDIVEDLKQDSYWRKKLFEIKRFKKYARSIRRMDEDIKLDTLNTGGITNIFLVKSMVLARKKIEIKRECVN